MTLRLLVAATAVALLTPAAGLAFQGSADRGALAASLVESPAEAEVSAPAEAKETESTDEIRDWMDKVAGQNEALDDHSRAIMSELKGSLLKEATFRAKRAELKMLEYLLYKWDGEKPTTKVSLAARRTAAFAFHKAVRRHLRRPAKAERRASKDADLQTLEAMKNWSDEATRASQDLERQMGSEESDFGEAVPKGEEEKDMERLKELIDSVDPKNVSEMTDLAAALAQAASKRRPRRRAALRSSEDQAEADAKMLDAMKAWVEEANKATHDEEKEVRSEESDLGEAVPKGQEEKDMEKLKELLDEVDPTNASEIADLAAALGQSRRAPKRRVVRHSSPDPLALDDNLVQAMRDWMEGTNRTSQGFVKMWEAMKDWADDARKSSPELERIADILERADPKSASELSNFAMDLVSGKTGSGKQESEDSESKSKRKQAVANWMAQASKATSELDEEIDEAISDLLEEVPKSDEEKDLERMQRLIDSVDPENASEVADLSESLAKDRSFTHLVGTPPERKTNTWTEADNASFWNWLHGAEEATAKLDRELEANEKEFVDYLAQMTAPQAEEVHAELKTLEEIWNKYGFDNESAPEDFLEDLQPSQDVDGVERGGAEAGKEAQRRLEESYDTAANSKAQPHMKKQDAPEKQTHLEKQNAWPHPQERSEAAEETQPPPQELYGAPGGGFCHGKPLFDGPSFGWKDCRLRCDVVGCKFWSYWHNSPNRWCKLTQSCDSQMQDGRNTISAYMREKAAPQ